MPGGPQAEVRVGLAYIVVCCNILYYVTVKHEMFGNRFELGFSGDAFRPQRVTVRTDCQDIVRLDVTYERQPMSHDMAPRLPRELRQQQWQQQYVRTAAAKP